MLGINPTESRQRMDEALGVIMRLFTELDPITSSGTTGTMSFTPKDRSDWRTFILGGFRIQLLQEFG